MFEKMRYPRSEKLIEKIIEKYPWILDDCIEVFVPDIWHDLVLNTISKIEIIFKKHKMSFCKEKFQITQIKEKFGFLRIYTDYYDKKQYYENEMHENICNILDGAELKSGQFCSVCGSKEKISGPIENNKNTLPAKCPNCMDKSPLWRLENS